MDSTSSHEATSEGALQGLHDNPRRPVSQAPTRKTPNISEPRVLSFVNYQAGDDIQNAESRRTVKSHVTRTWHRDKRVAETMRYAQSQKKLGAASSIYSDDVQRYEGDSGKEPQMPAPSVALPYLEGCKRANSIFGNDAPMTTKLEHN